MKKVIHFMIGMLLSLSAYAQTQKISGTVLDKSSNSPLPNVFVQGIGRSSTTDSSGRFAIDAENGETLTFSLVGFQIFNYKITSTSVDSLAVELEPLSSSLEAVVVTGYTKERKKDLTGAVSIVSVDDLNKQTTANPIKALQGQVAGVYITGDGSPSASSANIQIRGVGTLNSTQPLYIIDGVPTEAGMHELNANDIESMQILKDASAASIYGARAANGVIVITTKKGKAGRLNVNFNGRTSVSDYAYRMKVLDAEGYGKAMWQAMVNSGIDPNTNSMLYQYDWGLDDNGTPVLNKILLPEYLDDAKTEKTSNTDWFDEITHPGIAQDYNLTLSNGNDKGTYLFSTQYYDNDGIVKTTNFKRYSMRLNTTYKLLDDRITVGENFTLNRTREVQLPDDNIMNIALQILPIIPVHTVDGVGWGGPEGGMNDRQNPVRLLEDYKDNHYTYLRIFGNVFADVKLFKGLIFRTNYGVDHGNYNSYWFRKKYVSGYLSNDVNKLIVSESRTTKQNWSNTFQYTNDFGKHHLDALAGTEYYHQYDDNFWASAEGFDSEDPDYTYLDAGTSNQLNGGSASENALFSYFGKINYSFDGRYLASFTLRRDGSSRFGKNNRYGWFPAFSLGWRISQESFFQRYAPSFLSDLKLRFGWGQTGNQEIGNTGIYSLYVTDYTGGDPTWSYPTSTAYDIYGTGSGTLSSGYRQTQIGNENLKWESSTMSNWGLDFGFMDNKLTGSFDYFIKNTNDILINPAWIAVLGEGGSTWVNGASMRNQGWEVALNYNGQVKEGWTYTISGNISGYRNKVTELPESVLYTYGGNGSTDNILGRPLGSFYGYVADGLFRTQKQVDEAAAQTGKGLGRIRYKDLNNDGTIDTDDRTWIGNPNPQFTYGLNLAMKYKNLDLSAFFQGVNGNDINNEVKQSTDFWSVTTTGSNKGTRLLNAWSVSNPDSDIPALTYNDDNTESRFSTYFVEKGSYLKLRNLQLGYSLSKSILQKMKIASFRVYAGGDNLLLIWKSKSFTGVDPETAAYTYPNPRTFTFGVNMSL
ncbi:MAG: TonB-dependent receptor [Chitinophagaceae bacterium]